MVISLLLACGAEQAFPELLRALPTFWLRKIEDKQNIDEAVGWGWGGGRDPPSPSFVDFSCSHSAKLPTHATLLESDYLGRAISKEGVEM